MADMSAVSVIIPVFNRAHCVGRAIASVLAQETTGCAIELIIVDDGSYDDLAGAVRGFGAAVKCVRHERNRGAAAARNTGVAAARAEYIAFLDSDDTWLPGKLAAQLAFMEANGPAASCTAYWLKHPNATEFVSPRYATGTLSLADLVWGCFVSPGSTLLCRRETFAEIGNYDETLRRLEDWDWLLRYAQHHRLGFLARPLARIEVAPQAHTTPSVLAALDRLEARHLPILARADRRCFASAVSVERAAALLRANRRFAGLAALASAVCQVPIGNAALASVLHNRIGGRRPWKAHATPIGAAIDR